MIAEIVVQPDDIIKEGWILKESLHLKTWRRRWLVLTPEYLYTFRSKGDYRNPTEVIPLCECSSAKASKDLSHFSVISQSRTFLLTAGSHEEQDAWLRQLAEHMPSSTAIIEHDDTDSFLPIWSESGLTLLVMFCQCAFSVLLDFS